MTRDYESHGVCEAKLQTESQRPSNHQMYSQLKAVEVVWGVEEGHPIRGEQGIEVVQEVEVAIRCTIVSFMR